MVQALSHYGCIVTPSTNTNHCKATTDFAAICNPQIGTVCGLTISPPPLQAAAAGLGIRAHPDQLDHGRALVLVLVLLPHTLDVANPGSRRIIIGRAYVEGMQGGCGHPAQPVRHREADACSEACNGRPPRVHGQIRRQSPPSTRRPSCPGRPAILSACGLWASQL
jgi:hypothetical protein